MKDFALEILNSGNSENVSLLSEEVMSETLGGEISCKKGFHLGDNGAVSCGCQYVSDKPIVIVQPSPQPGTVIIG